MKEGDQAYGAVVVRDGVIMGEAGTTSCFIATAHVELLAVRDAARRLPMCLGALYWARIRRYHNDSTAAAGVAPKLAC